MQLVVLQSSHHFLSCGHAFSHCLVFSYGCFLLVSRPWIVKPQYLSVAILQIVLNSFSNHDKSDKIDGDLSDHVVKIRSVQS